MGPANSRQCIGAPAQGLDGRDFQTSALFDGRVQIHEMPPHLPGQQLAHSGFAAAHEACQANQFSIA